MSRMVLPVSEIPGVIRESTRCVLVAHGFAIVDKRGALITDERLEQLLRELGNNVAQGLYSIDETPNDDADEALDAKECP